MILRMNQTSILSAVKAVSLLCIFFLISCNNNKKAPPFPAYENEYLQPETKSFSFSEPDTLTWIVQDPSKIKPLPTTKFDWDKLPTKPFDIGNPYVSKESRPNKPLNWDNLPIRDFDLDSLPKHELKIKVTVLGTPKIVKAGFQENAIDVSKGVMSFDEDFGYPGNIFCNRLDIEGMLWFGGNTGIARYDGENLEIYDQEQGLRSNTILMLYQDSQGRIWTADNQGVISVIDFSAKLIFELSSALDQGETYEMLEASDGKFWIPKVGIGYNYSSKRMTN